MPAAVGLCRTIVVSAAATAAALTAVLTAPHKPTHGIIETMMCLILSSSLLCLLR